MIAYQQLKYISEKLQLLYKHGLISVIKQYIYTLPWESITRLKNLRKCELSYVIVFC